MAKGKKLLDIKGDWKKDSTGGKIITAFGVVSIAGTIISLAKNLINKTK